MTSLLATEELKSTSLSLADVTVRFRLFFLDFFLLLPVESVSFTRFARLFFLLLPFLEDIGERERDRDFDRGLPFLPFREDLGDRLFLFFGDLERSMPRSRFLKGDREDLERFLRIIGDLDR